MKVFYMQPVTEKFEETAYLLEYVSENRKQKVIRYRNDCDKILSLYAALLVRMELSRISSIAADKLTFSAESMRKPVCLDNICDFSISHTRNLILLALSETSAVGADTEKIKKTQPEIAERYFSEEEKQFLSCRNEQKENCFYNMWTLKEAYCKYKGTGLSEEVLKTNTLSEAFRQHSFSFVYHDYICSVYTDTEEIMKKCIPQLVTEQELLSFFRK